MQINDAEARINSDDIGLVYFWSIMSWMWWVWSIVEGYWPGYRTKSMNKDEREEDGGGEVSIFTDHLKASNETEVMQVEGNPPSFQEGYGQDDGMQFQEKVPSGIEHKSLVPHTSPPEDSYLHTQFRRLHGCIQPAASRLQDSSNKERATKRVAILVSLIPRNPSFPIGMQVCV